MSKSTRRVVTGHDEHGKSVIVSDGDVYPLANGGKRTVMHRTRTLDYAVVIEGELVLILDDSESTLKPGDEVVQRGTDHALENRTAAVARATFFHMDTQFGEELLARLPKPLALLGYE